MRRAMRRGLRLEYLEDKPEHMAWCWLAAQQGAFDGIELPEEKPEFGSALIQSLAECGIAEAMLVIVPDEEPRAAGLWMWLGSGKRIEPHVEWFPWASPRDRLEGTIKFLNEARKNRIALCFTKQTDYRFWQHVRLYGVLKWGCEIPGYFDDGSAANLFITREQWGI